MLVAGPRAPGRVHGPRPSLHRRTSRWRSRMTGVRADASPDSDSQPRWPGPDGRRAHGRRQLPSPRDFPGRSASSGAAAATMISMNGGDVITLPAPRAPCSRRLRVGTAWRRVSAASGAGLPAIGVAAVLVSVNVSSASRQGRSPCGRPEPPRRSWRGVVQKRIDLRTQPGQARVVGLHRPADDCRQASVGVKVVGYVPEMAPLVVPETAATSVRRTSPGRRSTYSWPAGVGPGRGHGPCRRGHDEPRDGGRLAAHLDTRDHRGDRRPRLPRR